MGAWLGLAQSPHKHEVTRSNPQWECFFRLTFPSVSPFFLVVLLPHACTQVKKNRHTHTRMYIHTHTTSAVPTTHNHLTHIHTHTPHTHHAQNHHAANHQLSSHSASSTTQLVNAWLVCIRCKWQKTIVMHNLSGNNSSQLFLGTDRGPKTSVSTSTQGSSSVSDGYKTRQTNLYARVGREK